MWLGAIQRVEVRTGMSGLRFGDGLGGRGKKRVARSMDYPLWSGGLSRRRRLPLDDAGSQPRSVGQQVGEDGEEE